MNFTKTMFALAVGSVGIMGAMSAHAATLSTGDVLTINAGSQTTDGSGGPTAFATGSWFGMDTGFALGTIGMTEQVLISPSSLPGAGITIGVSQAAGTGTYHAGGSLPGDQNTMMHSWDFSSATGINFTTTPITGGTTGLDMSGWNVAWSGVAAIPMTGGTWIRKVAATSTPVALTAPFNCGAIGMSCSAYTSGMAQFSWDGVYGSTYTLDYIAAVPLGDPSGFGGTQYALHLEGTVQAVPEASTYGMMLAGLGLVGFAVRRRKLV